MLARPFPYYRISHHQWSDYLSRIHFESEIQIEIPWGVHEVTRRVTSAPRASKLNLERLFALLHQLNLKARLKIGFYATHSIPQWLWSSERRLIVPGLGLTPALEGNLVVSVPDFSDPEFSSAFSAFVGEVKSQAELYTGSDGPIVGCELDPGFYRNVWSLPDERELSEHLREKYQDSKEFMGVYGIACPNLDGHEFLKRLGGLISRRSWIACADVRTTRRRTLSRWLNALTLEHELFGLSKKKTGLVCASEHCELLAGQLVPYAPGGRQYGEILRSYNKVVASAASWMSQAREEAPSNSPSRVLVLCDKWIHRSVIQDLLNRANAGELVRFVPHFPVFDEKMTVLTQFQNRKLGKSLNAPSESMTIPFGAGALSSDHRVGAEPVD